MLLFGEREKADPSLLCGAHLLKSNTVAVVGILCFLSPPSTISFEKRRKRTCNSERLYLSLESLLWERKPNDGCMGFDMIPDRMTIIITYSMVLVSSCGTCFHYSLNFDCTTKHFYKAKNLFWKDAKKVNVQTGIHTN
jgi:hypothetical protein